MSLRSGAGVLTIRGLSSAESADLIAKARELSAQIGVEVAGQITLDNVRAYAEAGPDVIRVDALTQSVRAMDINFQIQPG